MIRRSNGNRWEFGAACRWAVFALGAALLLPLPAMGQEFRAEASVSYVLSGRARTTLEPEVLFGSSDSRITQNPLAEPVELTGTMSRTVGGGNNVASVLGNATLQGSAGIMRARLGGSTSTTWIDTASAAEARIAIATAEVGWKDGFVVRGNPADPRPGRALTIHSYLLVHGGMSSSIDGGFSTLDVQMQLTGTDRFGRNILAMAPPYSGSFATELNHPTLGHVSRVAPGIIPLQLEVNEDVLGWMDFRMKLNAVAVSQTPGFGLPEPRTSSASFEADYGHTLTWGGITSIVDTTTGLPVTGWSIIAASGVDYAQAVPEPGALFGCIALLPFARRPRRRH